MFVQGRLVVLRALEIEDMEALRETVNDSELENLLGGWSFPISKSAQLEWFNNCANDKNNVRYAIETKDDHKFIGMISLTNIDWKNRSGMIAIKLTTNAPHGKGYGYDAEIALLNYAFNELNLHRITANILEYNKVSINFHTKIGLKKEGINREAIYKRGKYHNVITFGILKKDYLDIAQKNNWPLQ